MYTHTQNSKLGSQIHALRVSIYEPALLHFPKKSLLAWVYDITDIHYGAKADRDVDKKLRSCNS